MCGARVKSHFEGLLVVSSQTKAGFNGDGLACNKHHVTDGKLFAILLELSCNIHCAAKFIRQLWEWLDGAKPYNFALLFFFRNMVLKIYKITTTGL